MKIRMTADSTCDLTPELIRKYNIGIAPLSVIIDGEVFHDGVDVSPRDIFRAAEAGKSVRTAAVNTYEYREFFTEQMKSCDQIVHVCLSSEFSTSYADAVEAVPRAPPALMRAQKIHKRAAYAGFGLKDARTPSERSTTPASPAFSVCRTPDIIANFGLTCA